MSIASNRTQTMNEASEALGEDVFKWLRYHWTYGLTWQQMRIELAQRGGPVVKPETLRRWDYERRRRAA